MKTAILFYILFIIVGIQVPGELKVVVNNIAPVEGDIYVAIYDHPEKYMSVDMAVFKQMVPIKEETETIIFSNVPEGEYAIAVFQDLNGNGELDLKSTGIPKEPFGFSNDDIINFDISFIKFFKNPVYQQLAIRVHTPNLSLFPKNHHTYTPDILD